MCGSRAAVPQGMKGRGCRAEHGAGGDTPSRETWEKPSLGAVRALWSSCPATSEEILSVKPGASRIPLRKLLLPETPHPNKLGTSTPHSWLQTPNPGRPTHL